MSNILTVCYWLSKSLKHKICITGRWGEMVITDRTWEPAVTGTGSPPQRCERCAGKAKNVCVNVLMYSPF